MTRMLSRPAMLFFAVAQLLLAFAPIAEGRLGASADTHAEGAGTGLHHAHDEANCTACLGRQLVASSDVAAASKYIPSRTLRSGAATSPERAVAAVLNDSRPRAPPSVSI